MYAFSALSCWRMADCTKSEVIMVSSHFYTASSVIQTLEKNNKTTSVPWEIYTRLQLTELRTNDLATGMHDNASMNLETATKSLAANLSEWSSLQFWQSSKHVHMPKYAWFRGGGGRGKNLDPELEKYIEGVRKLTLIQQTATYGKHLQERSKLLMLCQQLWQVLTTKPRTNTDELKINRTSRNTSTKSLRRAN